MESFVYDYYGYNIDEIINGSFVYQNYCFLLAATSDDEQSIESLTKLVDKLRITFNDDVVYIVKNKYSKYVSSTEDENNICMLTYKNDDSININHFVKMHTNYYASSSYLISMDDVITLWEQRLDYIQNQCLNGLNFENEVHVTLYEYTMYAVGMALNSLQYLSDIKVDFNNKKYATTLCHRRIKKLDKLNLFNPFNIIYDHSSRDLAELYKNELITLDVLLDITMYYNYTPDEYEYLLARLLFPTFIFDIVEDINMDNRNDNNNLIYFAIAKQNTQLDLALNYYNSVKKMTNIRQIRWLSNQYL